MLFVFNFELGDYLLVCALSQKRSDGSLAKLHVLNLLFVVDNIFIGVFNFVYDAL
jgi:hypothetical protein